jgi:hypothetical protein
MGLNGWSSGGHNLIWLGNPNSFETTLVDGKATYFLAYHLSLDIRQWIAHRKALLPPAGAKAKDEALSPALMFASVVNTTKWNS